MGAHVAIARPCTLHDSDRRPLSLEFSLAAIFPSRARHLRRRGVAFKAGVTGPGYSGTGTCRFDERCRVDFPHHWFVRFPAHLDFYWIGFGLGLSGVPVTSL